MTKKTGHKSHLLNLFLPIIIVITDQLLLQVMH